jgi:uncharacterized protein YbcI
MPGTEQERPSVGSMSAAISNAVVRLLTDYTGRGATKARTYICEDYIAVVLQDTLTKGERSLVRDGRTELVLTSRKAYQDTMGADLIAIVEQISGRKVLAFLSDNHLNPDIAVESFVLVPQNGSVAGGPSQTG